MLTGVPPRDHGIVGNGHYDRDLAEVHFWKQSNHLVQKEKVWETARKRDPSVTCANICWWFNMHSNVDVAVTPRPIYCADGRKLPDCYTQPMGWRDDLQAKLGPFPLFQFWGPGASIQSSQWIADAARSTVERYDPTLTLVYLPHLDYALQKLGPGHAEIPKHLGEVDGVVGGLLDFFSRRDTRVLLVSEYGVEPVHTAIPLNRTLREAGLLSLRFESGREMLDPGGCRALAVADHQVAHLYVRDPADVAAVHKLAQNCPGVAQVYDRQTQHEIGLDHPRAGDLVAVASEGCWFSYGWWQDQKYAPDYARTVDIHRKPGYDPLELFIDPAIRSPRLSIGWRLLKKKLGMRTLMDVIPLDTKLVKGSHGRIDMPDALQPILIAPSSINPPPGAIPCEGVYDVILRSLFEG